MPRRRNVQGADPVPVRFSDAEVQERRNLPHHDIERALDALRYQMNLSQNELREAVRASNVDLCNALQNRIGIMQDFEIVLGDQRTQSIAQEVERSVEFTETLRRISSMPITRRREHAGETECTFNGQKVHVYMSPAEGARIGFVVSTPRGSYAKRVISLLINPVTGKMQFYRDAIPLRESPEHGLSLMTRDSGHLVISERKE